MSSSPSPTASSSSPSASSASAVSVSSPASAGAGPMDRLYGRLERAFPVDPRRKDAKGVVLTSSSARPDDASMDALYELDRYLASSAKNDCARHHSALVKLLLERAALRCGESGMSRQLVAHVLLLLMELNSVTLSHVYSDVLALMGHKEQSPRLAGLAMFAPLVERFGQQFLLNTADVVSLLTKLSKRDEAVCKELVLDAVAAVYRGTGGPRSTDSTSVDLVSLITRLSKSSEKGLRCASAQCIDVVLQQSSDGRERETLLPICVKALLDADLEVRYVNADVLGRILYYCTQKVTARVGAAQLSTERSRVTEAAKRVKLKYEIRSVDDALDTIHKLFATAPHYKLKASLSVCLTRLMLCSVDGVDEGVMSGYVMTIIGFVFKTSGADSEREGRQLAACIGDAIVTGVLSRQRERGLEVIARAVLAALHQNNATNELNEYQIMVACDCLSFIFNRLSSAMEHLEISDTALDVLLFLLTSSSHSLRLYAAQTFRCLARAASSHIATWLSVVEKIIAIQLSEVLDGGRGKEAGAADPYWSLHGHMSALSAVVGVIPECSGGVSLAMLDSVFEVAKRLIGVDPSQHTTVAAWQLNECGWTLLASLIGLGSEWVAPRLNTLFSLWRNVLGRSPPTTPQRVEDIASDLRVRGKALVALRAFAHVMRHRIVVQAAGAFSPVLKATRVFLCTNFSLVKALQSAKDLEPVIVAALATVKPVLMDVFSAIPPASFTSYFSRLLKFIVAEFTSGSPACSTELHRLLNPADHSLLYTPSAETRMQRFLDLHRPVQPGARGRDDGEAQDDSGGAFVCIEPRSAGGSIAIDWSWNWVLRPDSYTYSQVLGDDDGGGGSGGGRAAERRDELEDVSSVEGMNRSHHVAYSSRNNTDHQALHAFECFEHNALRSTNACIRLFAAIYADQSATYKEQLMKHLHALCAKHKAQGSLHSHAVTNIATAVLAVCRDQAQREQPIGSANALHAMVAIATELLAAPSALVRRAAGEILGLLVHLEDDTFLSRITAVLREQLASKDVNVLCAAVFAFGCVHRYGGGMKTIRSLTFTVASLQLMGRDFTEPLRLWILHALWLTVETGGLSFSAYAQPTLSIVWSHAMHDCEARPPLLTLTIGRILHAVIAALGPEVSQAAAASASSGLGVERFLNLYFHLQADPQAQVQVQVVETANQLVLWNAIGDEERLTALLVSGLQSEEDELRRSSVKCVLRWGEKDARVVSKAQMASRLLQLMDRETSHAILALIRHAFNTFIKLHSTREPKGSAERPTRWFLLDTLKRAMVGGSHKLPSDGSAAPASGGAGAGEHARKEKDSSKQQQQQQQQADDDEDEDGIMGGSPSDGAKTSSSPSGGPSSSAASAALPTSASAECRWQTKAFALACVSHLLQAVKAALPASEFDLAYARKQCTYPTQFLVQQLVDLLTVACMATSSSYDSLRIKGTLCMLHVVQCFADVVDPDGEGELLLQLYNAQVTSAMTASMKNKSEAVGSAPQLRAAACELSVIYLVSGVTDDEVVVARTIRMLLTPLQRPQDVALWYAQYDGNMATMVLLSHLSALCQLQLATRAAAVASSTGGVGGAGGGGGGGGGKRRRKQPRLLALSCIAAALEPNVAWLQQQYVLALRDFALTLVTQKKDMQRTKGAFFDGAACTRVVDVFAPVWAVFLSATAEVGVEDADGEQGRRDTLLLVSIVLSALHTIFAYEVIAVQRRRGVDTSVSEADREREQRQVLLCLAALPKLLTPEALTNAQGAPLFDLAAELLPLLSWALQHRLAAEPSTVQPRQLAAAAVLSSLLDTLQQALAHSGVPPLPASSSTLAELLHALSESLASAVYQHLPLSALSSPDASPSNSVSRHSADTGGRAELASADIYIGEEALAFLTAALDMVPRLAALWLSGAQAQRRWQQLDERRDRSHGEDDAAAASSPLAVAFPFPTPVYLCALLQLCLHVMRQGNAALAERATRGFQAALDAFCAAGGPRQHPTAFASLSAALLSELHAHALHGQRRLDVDFRVSALLTAAWRLCSAPAAPHAGQDDDLLSAQTAAPVDHAQLRALAVVLNAALAAPHCQLVSLEVLAHAAFASPESSASSPLQHAAADAAAASVLALTAPSLLALLHRPASSDCALRAARCVEAACTRLVSHTAALLPLALPCLIASLSASPASLSCITALATSAPVAFKHVVAGLSPELKSALQSAALQAQAQAQTGSAASVESADGVAKAADANGAAVDGERAKSKEKGKAKKKKRSDSAHLNAVDAISLSTDFSAFAKRR